MFFLTTDAMKEFEEFMEESGGNQTEPKEFCYKVYIRNNNKIDTIYTITDDKETAKNQVKARFPKAQIIRTVRIA